MLLLALLSLVVVPAPHPTSAARGEGVGDLLVPLPIEVDGEGWSGPGADFLLEALRASRVVAIGEQHGNRETPLVTRALLRAARPLGYEAFAVEVGPLTGERLEALLAGDGGLAPLEEHLATYPLSVPFFNWRGEAELLHDALDLGYDVWGLDQEFIASGRVHLDRLAELVDDEAAARVVELQERAWRGFEAGFAERDSSQAFLVATTDVELAELAELVAGAGEEARTIVEELRESAAVYRLYGAGRNYASNHRRIALMKRHLARRVPDLGADGRLVLRFGNVHMGRGYSPLNQLDLGNQAAELAVLRGGDSFHLTVAGLSRVANDGSVSDYLSQAPHLAAFGSPDDTSWSVFDLRPLRPVFHDERARAGHEALSDLCWRFDAVLVVPRMTEAEELVR